ncbi:unnamed protein product [Dovyalis caffra]|uniref:Uncharacterized protein n=1 Tax=Dovyalis caffra TaxID=77055 RepID=A0AAV1S963_9ROSI|nr:unnamed protein product [Dovyalis caffra]
MGCFFTCFRPKDERSNRSRPHAISSDSLRSKPALKEESLHGDIENPCLGSPKINKGLRDERLHLKFGKLAKSLKVRLLTIKIREPSKFHSWLPNTSMEKFQMDNQTDQPPTPVKLCEEWGKSSVSSEQTPSSCITTSEDGESGKRVIKVLANESDNVVAGPSWLSATNVQSRNKSVRFECDFDTSSSTRSSSENSCQVPRKYESPGNLNVSKLSPKPTPLKLSDDMQTPGTVFPANLETLANGKTTIRSQYVYSVLNPVENASQWKLLKEDDFNSLKLSGQLSGSLEQSESATPKPEWGVKETSTGKDLKAEASLSSWVKPPQSAHDEDNTNVGTASIKNFRFGRTPGDRPIIGMVAAHWNENEPSEISPKWWDGNGIPNSTNKYKEVLHITLFILFSPFALLEASFKEPSFCFQDQKVSWHATPFEERLEKALSEESFISQRKPISGRPVVFDECEESDTAVSRLQASTQAKSVGPNFRRGVKGGDLEWKQREP